MEGCSSNDRGNIAEGTDVQIGKQHCRLENSTLLTLALLL